MTCHAYVLTWVGLLLMQHLGLAPTMSLIITWGFKENFCSCDFWCMDFWVVFWNLAKQELDFLKALE